MGFATTLNVLKSSIINGISGWFRLYIAFILIGKVSDLILCFAFSFVVYSVYTLDRTLKSKEDEINRPEEKNADRNIIFFIISTLLFITVLILAFKKVSPLVELFPFVMGFLYTKGLEIGSISIRFKQGLGIKNFVAAFTWAFTIIAFIHNFTMNNIQSFWLFIFFFFKSFINTVLFDCKDIQGDSAAGLNTIPIFFGEQRTRIILQIINSSFYLIFATYVFSGLFKFDTIILLCSLAASSIYIHLYANRKKTIFRSVIVHGEWIYLLAFRYLAIQFFRNASHSN
jgi:4-hydroxybenzoate polyprenyltransferase